MTKRRRYEPVLAQASGSRFHIVTPHAVQTACGLPLEPGLPFPAWQCTDADMPIPLCRKSGCVERWPPMLAVVQGGLP